MADAHVLWGDSDRSADLFHHLPLAIVDPFLYVESNGTRMVVTNVNERQRVEDLQAGYVVRTGEDYGRDELLAQGLDYDEAEIAVAVRACRDAGVTRAIVPPMFPLGVADPLREAGIEVVVDAKGYALRRRVKTPVQVEGIRRAQRAADAAMAAAAARLAEAPDGLTSEAVREEMALVCRRHECDLPDDVIVAVGAQSTSGHEPGHGPIRRGDAVLIDIWPRDRRSRCWADMTRTFVAGGERPSDELRRYWELTREALDAATAMIRPGVNGRDVYGRACEVYEAAGIETQRTKEPGTVLEDGFYHGLGHGVGIEVHEAPTLGRAGDDLLAGDVVTVEPGCYRQGFGGVRLEDLVLVTEGGREVLTNFRYELDPRG